ncbi:MAG: hypothetical protein ABFS17_11910 [Chloroflexota bacterium]
MGRVISTIINDHRLNDFGIDVFQDRCSGILSLPEEKEMVEAGDLGGEQMADRLVVVVTPPHDLIFTKVIEGILTNSCP